MASAVRSVATPHQLSSGYNRAFKAQPEPGAQPKWYEQLPAGQAAASHQAAKPLRQLTESLEARLLDKALNPKTIIRSSFKLPYLAAKP
jgi:hypothetical protein